MHGEGSTNSSAPAAHQRPCLQPERGCRSISRRSDHSPGRDRAYPRHLLAQCNESRSRAACATHRSRARRPLRHYHRLLQQMAQEIEDFFGTQEFRRTLLAHLPPSSMVGANRLRRLQGPAIGEHRQAVKQQALLVAEEVIAPVHQRAQRLLPRQRRPAATRQHPEAILHAVEQLPHRQQPVAAAT